MILEISLLQYFQHVFIDSNTILYKVLKHFFRTSMDIEFGKGLKHNSEKWFITGH